MEIMDMNVLAFLISGPHDGSAHDRPDRILFGIRTTEEEGDEEHLRRFSDILLGLEQGECTFNPAFEIPC